MGIVIDRVIFIAAERRRFNLTHVLTAHSAEPFFLAAITASELLHGCLRAKANGHSVATLNRGEFARVSGLVLAEVSPFVISVVAG